MFTPNEQNLVVDASTYGAKGDNVTDSYQFITNALVACPSGGIVYLPAGGIYRTSAPLVIPPNITLEATHGNRVESSTGIAVTTMIKPLASFSGAACIKMLDKEQGGYSANNGGQRIRHITLDGSAIAGTIDAINASGYVHDVQLENVCARNFPQHGFSSTRYIRLDTSVVWPFSWTLINCIAHNNAGSGFTFDGLTDSELISVEA